THTTRVPQRLTNSQRKPRPLPGHRLVLPLWPTLPHKPPGPEPNIRLPAIKHPLPKRRTPYLYPLLRRNLQSLRLALDPRLRLLGLQSPARHRPLESRPYQVAEQNRRGWGPRSREHGNPNHAWPPTRPSR